MLGRLSQPSGLVADADRVRFAIGRSTACCPPPAELELPLAIGLQLLAGALLSA